MEGFNFTETIQEKQLDFYSAYVPIPPHAWLVWEVLWWAPNMVSSVTCVSSSQRLQNEACLNIWGRESGSAAF